MKTKYFWIGEYTKIKFCSSDKSMILWHHPEEGGDIKQIIVGSIIDTSSVKSKIKDKDLTEVEHWLNKQKWYSHDSFHI
jgi:hypothetical protein